MTETDDAIARAVETQIKPGLAAVEASRRGYLQLTRLMAAGVFGFFGVIALLLWALISIYVALFVFAGAFVFGGIAAWALVRFYRGTARARIVPPLAEAIGGMTYKRSGEGFDARAVAELGILPPARAVLAEDLLEGMHRGTGFRMVAMSCFARSSGAVRIDGRRARAKRVWRGLVVEVDVPVAFEGPVILARDRGAIGRWLGNEPAAGRGLAPVSFPDAAFGDAFEVYAADAGEAARLITPELAASLVALSKARPGKALAAAFAQGVFLLTIPLPRGFLDQGSLFEPAERLLDRIPAIVRELTLPHRVIDYLMGDRPGPLL